MSSDNTSLALGDRRNSRVDLSFGESRSSDNTWLSSLAEKCVGHRTMSRPKGNYEDFLSSVFGCPGAETLERMYSYEQMSVSDIHAWLVDNVGWSVGVRQINKIMARNGIRLRGYAERKRLSWKQGKMDDALAKSRVGCKQAFFIGSGAEKMVRYLLQVSLSALRLPWQVVIGDHLQLILPRYEVDIPVVVMDPLTGLSCRFALEVDNTFTHGNTETQSRDRLKDEALRESGWMVYRVNGDSVSPIHIVPQVVDVAVDIKRVCGQTMNADGGRGKADIVRSSALPPTCYRHSSASSSLSSAR